MRRTFACLTQFLCLTFVSGYLFADNANLAFEARNVLKTHCARCHSGPGSDGGDFNMLNVEDLLKQELVKPGDATQSLLLKRIEKGEMPPQPASISINEIDTIRQWIHAGAPKFLNEEAKRDFIPLKKILEWRLDYLRKTPAADRQYLRFFTLHNLYNDARVLNKDLRLYRAALAKVINSLSMKNRIVLPKSIDKDLNILYVIDVRDYDWDRKAAWNEIMMAYPYGLGYRNLDDAELQALDEEIELLTGCFISMVRADWFIATASRPPLYYQMLDMPLTAGELEKSLKVDIKANYMNPTPERIARAGFHKSGVSAQNRMLERHETDYGYYWKSYDFKAGSSHSKLTRFPLGPVNLFAKGKHPFELQSFKHDGGEIIYSLPNGLQAYLLVDGDDKRIEAGPIEVVGDSLKTSGNHAIVNGVSCMSCHKHGILEFKDYIRDGNALFGDPLQKVYDLYPKQNVMDTLVTQDKDRFMAALRKTMENYLLIEEDKTAKLEEFPDPVGELSRFYRLSYLDLRTVASEVDIQNPEELRNKIGEKNLKKLGLEALMQKGGAISRLEWESIDGVSLMQELSRELRYTPKAIR
jgi:Planctomycete cytochrome C